MLMTVAKLGNPELVGQFSLAFAIAAPVFIFSQMQLRQIQVTDVKGEYNFADYFWNRLLATLLALLVVVAIVVCSGYSGAMASLILLIALAKAFESMADVTHGRMQRHDRMDLAAISLALKGLLSCAALGLIFWRTRDLVLAVSGMGAVWAAVFFLYDLPAQRAVRAGEAGVRSVRVAQVWRLTVLALPLAAAAGLGSFSGNLPRYYLEHYHGKAAVAQFSVAAALLLLLGLFTGSVCQGVVARAATYLQTGQLAAFKRLMFKLTGLQLAAGCAFALVCLFAGEQLIALMFTDEYRSAAPALLIMLLGLLLGYLATFGCFVLVAGRKLGLQLLVLLIVLAIQIPAGCFLIAHFGVLGAAWTDCVKQLTAAVIHAAFGAVVFHRLQASAPCPA